MKTPAKIKINKSIYSIVKMEKGTEDTEGYTTYHLVRGAKITKQLVHNTKTNDFTLYGGRVGYRITMTIPKHIELIN
jgi:hypothetical protein